MDTEEQKGNVMKYVVEKIWGNFLLEPNESNKSSYTYNEPQGNPEIPTVNDQQGAIQKIERWNPPIVKNITNDEQTPHKINMELVRPDFDRFRKRFLNPKISYASYRPGKVIPIQLPEGTTWEHITVKFLNGNDVEITLKNDASFKHIATYNELGFRDDKRKMPNKQWITFLAFAKSGGAIPWSSRSNLDIKLIYNLKTQKKLLSQGLRAYFQLDEDPFFDYNTEDGYKIKMRLIPEKPESVQRESKKDDLGIAEAYNEQAVSKFEDEPVEEQW